MPETLDQLTLDKPDLALLRQQHQQVIDQLDNAKNVDEKLAIIKHWDTLRRQTDTWCNLAYVRFAQNTQDPAAKADRDFMDALMPELTECLVSVKTRLLKDKTQLEPMLGDHIFQLWQLDVDGFDPALKADMEAESKLTAEYTDLCASAKLAFDGKDDHNLSSLRAFLDDVDRDKRHLANQTYWGFYQQHGDTLDNLFDQLVKLRHGMAQKLGYDTYTPLGYKYMQRLDYNANDVARYREQVVRDIVPLCQQIMTLRKTRLGLDSLYFWDEGIADLKGNPIPPVGQAMIPAAQQMFKETSPLLGDFFQMMTDKGLIDLDARPGKAGGGFCTFLPMIADNPVTGWPFIFCNSNGSMDDAVTLAHEIGHAFQANSSQHVPITDLQWPTSESAEIHSMALEFLTFDAAKALFGEDTARYQQIHLEKSLLFLPFGVAVDHFQHLVYAKPDATPLERHAMWQEMEALYMPWRQYGDLEGLAGGNMWLQKQHIFNSPFYYIDYTLALCCALQFWTRHRENPTATLADYVALCVKGGTAPFRQLVASAGLVSPFEDGALKTVAQQVKMFLRLPD